MTELANYFAVARGNAAKLARETGASAAFLGQIARGERPCPPKLAVRIERATSGAVSRKAFFPDDWHEWWPELAEKLATATPSSQEGAHA